MLRRTTNRAVFVGGRAPVPARPHVVREVLRERSYKGHKIVYISGMNDLMKHFPTFAAAAIMVGIVVQSASSETILEGTAELNPTCNKETEKFMQEAGNRAEAQILVRFDRNLTPVEIETINRRLGAKVVNVMSEGNLMLVEIAYPDIRTQIIEAYSATEGVVYAEPNTMVSIPEIPDQMDKIGDVTNPNSPLIGLPKISD